MAIVLATDIDQLQWCVKLPNFVCYDHERELNRACTARCLQFKWLFVRLTILSGITIDGREVDIDLQDCLCAGS